jgi:hypothetical protein
MPKLPRHWDILPTPISQHYTNMSERSTKYESKWSSGLGPSKAQLGCGQRSQLYIIEEAAYYSCKKTRPLVHLYLKLDFETSCWRYP